MVKTQGNTRVKRQPPPKFTDSSNLHDNKLKEIGLSDLTLLSKVTDQEINDNLYKRFKNGIMYTYIGHVVSNIIHPPPPPPPSSSSSSFSNPLLTIFKLISVNPFKDLGIYTQNVLDTYKGRNRLEVCTIISSSSSSHYPNPSSLSLLLSPF